MNNEFNNELKSTGFIHVHSENSIFDSPNKVKDLVKRAVEMNAPAITLTDHGTLTGIDDFMEVIEEYKKEGIDIKGIPGCEVYVQDENDIHYGHMVLLAKNETGYKAISLIVSESNKNIKNGIPILTKKELVTFFGKGSIGYDNVIATSACVGGIFAITINKNYYINKKIEKIKKQIEEYDEKEYQNSLMENISLDNKISELKTEKTENSKIVKKSFTKLEKQVEKSVGEEKEKLTEELKNKKEEKKNALDSLQKIEKELGKLNIESKKIKAKIKEVELVITKNKIIKENIKSLEKTKMTEKEILVELKEKIKFYNELFFNNFYIEVQNHGIPNEKIVYNILAKLAIEMNIPLVATNDVHFIHNSEEDYEAREVMKFLRWNSYSEPSIYDKELYMKSDKELADALLKILPEDIVKQAISNIKNVCDKCNVSFNFEKHYPVFSKVADANKLLREFCYKNISWRYPNKKDFDKVRQERLEYELDVIIKMGYANYFLIVQDFLNYGRLLGRVPSDRLDEAPLDLDKLRKWTEENQWDIGVGIGPGRGSAVGSIVAYILGITDIDPIKYDLFFERFLNVERVSMPDIDSDFKTDIRDKVIEYVKAKYGKESVCCIITKGTQAPKAAIRNAARYLSCKKYGDKNTLYNVGDKIAKAIPTEPGMKFSKCEDELQKFTSEDEKEIIRIAKLVEGTVTNYGMHAAGVIIADNGDVKQYVPLQWNDKKNRWVTQCNKEQAETRGLLKMDFLGLRNLNILTDCFKSVEQRKGIKIQLTDIKEEKKVFSEIISKALTNSVFQFESAGMKNMLKKFKPESMEDLILLVAVFRPGPLQYLESIIDVKHGRKKPDYVLPEMEEVLGSTYGYPVYQEQIMQIFNKFAGFSLGKADIIRRYMSKKKIEKFAKYRDEFINGLVERGANKERAEEFWTELEEFAKYAFNKSHATAYAYVAYYTAWAKYHYPAEYIVAVMNHINQNKLIGLINDAKELNIKVKTPDINLSSDKFMLNNNNEIIFGLSGIKNVGSQANIIYKMAKEKPFTSFKDFLLRCPVDRQVVESLIYAGAFDNLLETRKTGIILLNALIDIKKTIKDKQKIIKQLNNVKEIITKYNPNTIGDIFEIAEKNNIEIMTKSKLNKMPTTASMNKKIDNAEKKLKETLNEYNLIPVISVEENKNEMLKMEKEYLGSYVSGHPLDHIQIPDDCITIDNISENGKQKILGIISNFKSLKTKKDGKDMCTFTLEDKTGSVDCITYSKDYEILRNKLKDDNIFVFDGYIKIEVVEKENINSEETENNDSTVTSELKISFQVTKVENVSVSNQYILIKNKNIIDFQNKDFLNLLNKYIDNKGLKIFFIDFDKRMRETNYFVNESILTDSFIKAVKIGNSY